MTMRVRGRQSAKRAKRGGRSSQRGVAFVLVLWVIVMLGILLGSFSLVARTESLQSRHLFDSTQARYAAEAGLNLAVFELRKSDPAQQWIGDGRPYQFNYGDAQIEVRITDDSGKVDINAADINQLTSLFTARGLELDRAQSLAAAVIDWRDVDDDPQPNGAEIGEYKGAGLRYGPKNAPFDTVSELQQVLGMDYALFAALEPTLTIYSGRATPNAAYASTTDALVVAGCDPEQAQQLIQQRQALAPGDMAAAGLTGCDGTTPVVAGGGGLTYSVKSRATLPNGASTILDATIRMGGVSVAGRPFVILRWRDGETS
jgi:general secretion pathway protein K